MVEEAGDFSKKGTAKGRRQGEESVGKGQNRLLTTGYTQTESHKRAAKKRFPWLRVTGVQIYMHKMVLENEKLKGKVRHVTINTNSSLAI